MTFRGIDIRETGDRVVARGFVTSSNGEPVVGGDTVARLYELQSDGTLKSYDFDDNTFKTTALTTPELALTHQQGDNGTYATGIWTIVLSDLTGFTVGNIYLLVITNSNAAAAAQCREFQFGSGQEDVSTLGTVATATDGGDFTGNAELSGDSAFYATSIVVFLDGVNKPVARECSVYTGSTKRFQFTGATGDADDEFPSTPGVGDPFAIIGVVGS